jgi:hypothetical protein
MWKREGKGKGKRGPDDETSYSQGGKGKVKEVKMMEGGSFWGGLGPLLPMVYLDSTVRVLEISIAPTVICQYGMVRCGGERSRSRGGVWSLYWVSYKYTQYTTPYTPYMGSCNVCILRTSIANHHLQL